MDPESLFFYKRLYFRSVICDLKDNQLYCELSHKPLGIQCDPGITR